MKCIEWIDRLLRGDGAQVIPPEHIEELDVDCFVELKRRSDALLLENPSRALDIAEAACKAASVVSVPQIQAVAKWARGNALLCLGRYKEALTDYEQACAIYENSEGSDIEVARLRINIVGVLKNLGRYDEALHTADAARAALHELRSQSASYYIAILEMNVGSVYRLMSRYHESLAAYKRGRAILESLGNRVQVARIDINRARVLMCMDRFTEAESLLRVARDVLVGENKPLPAARADLNLATLLSRQGLHRQALVVYERARAVFDAMGDVTDVAVTDLYRTYDYLALNLLPEALALVTSAQEELSRQDMPRYVALAASSRAIAARKMGCYDEALRELTSARAFFAERRDFVDVALLDLERARCLYDMGDVDAAVAPANNALEVLTAYGLPLQSASALIVLADCFVELGKVESAASLYLQAMKATEGMPTLAWRVHYGLGRVAMAKDRHRDAYRHYLRAVECLEIAEEELGIDVFKAGFLDDKLMVYRRAVCLALDAGDLETALMLATRSKCGVWLDLACENEVAGEDISKDLRKWHWFYSRLTRTDGDLPRGGRGCEAQLQTLERRLFKARYHGERPVRRRPTLAMTALRERIPDGTLLIDYYCAVDQVIAFLLNADGTWAVKNLAPMSAVERALSRWRFNIESARLLASACDHGDGLPTILAKEAQRILCTLYQLLISPLEAYLADNQSLWIVPHESLWAIPFESLHDGHDYLLRRFQVTCLPTLAISFGNRDRGVVQSPLVIGCSDGGRLPYAVSEARAVFGTLGQGQLLLEDKATVEMVRELSSRCTLLHLATHGLFRADAPMFSALRLADGWLTANALEDWELSNVELAVLSACETGALISRGSDLLGLVRGFFRAGAKQLVVARWMVDDASTAQLMERFYVALRSGCCPTVALRQAQTAMLEERLHPFHWSGFMVLTLA